jgi:uncharacterized protein YraI
MEIRMRRTGLSLAAAVAGLLAVPGAASALTAVTTGSVPLRAGPAANFPVVDQVPADARVFVHGCVRAYRWCDISWRDAHGWMRGEELAYLQGSRRVSIIEYGPRVRLPIVSFSVDRYWDRYYRTRPFYGERARWRTVWRENDRREGAPRRTERGDSLRDTRSYRSINRESDRRTERGERLRDTRAYRNMDRENDRGAARTERSERLKDTRSYRGRDREDNRPNRAQGARGNQDSTVREGGRSEANAQDRSSGGPAGGGHRGGDKAPGGSGAGEGPKNR